MIGHLLILWLIILPWNVQYRKINLRDLYDMLVLKVIRFHKCINTNVSDQPSSQSNSRTNTQGIPSNIMEKSSSYKWKVVWNREESPTCTIDIFLRGHQDTGIESATGIEDSNRMDMDKYVKLYPKQTLVFKKVESACWLSFQLWVLFYIMIHCS